MSERKVSEDKSREKLRIDLGVVIDNWATFHEWKAESSISKFFLSKNPTIGLNIGDIIIEDRRDEEVGFSLNASLRIHPNDDASGRGEVIHFSVEGTVSRTPIFSDRTFEVESSWEVTSASVTSSGVVTIEQSKSQDSVRTDIFLLRQQELISESVEELFMRISKFDGKCWWRGHGDESWPLVPGISRGPTHSFAVEKELQHNFENQTMFLVSDSNSLGSDKVNFRMQHHGLPTRALDWSTSPLVALYFTVNYISDESEKENKTKDACLWMLDPCRLNNRSGKPFPFVSRQKIEGLFKEEHKEVLAVHAPYIDLRMKMQQSVFTIHGHHRALEKEKGVNLFLRRKIVIPYSLKTEIRKRLKALGVTRSTLFPDMDSIAKTIKEDVLG